MKTENSFEIVVPVQEEIDDSQNMGFVAKCDFD
jgi:hypothetical protein